ncbi:MAG: hypothetical protein IPN34_13775 [Planctomycetes bacterium]|nr:hypothetical protein [Planctomycetota bacterium]
MLAILLHGLRRDVWGPLSLPLDLGPGERPGRELLVAADAIQTLAVNGGRTIWTHAVPHLPQRIGVEISEQIAALDPAANPGGAVRSDRLALRLGRRGRCCGICWGCLLRLRSRGSFAGEPRRAIATP